MSLIVRAPQPISIDGWDIYNPRATQAGVTGIFGSAASVNRFHARYRFARSFKGFQLDGYSVATELGYSSLMRAALHWTAFEMFQRALNIKDTRYVLEKYPFDHHIEAIRTCLSSKMFFNSVRIHLTTDSQKIQLRNFVNGSPVSPLLLAKVLRHIFFHGSLTPHSGGSSPEEVTIICNELCDYMAEVMNGEFNERAQELAKAIG